MQHLDRNRLIEFAEGRTETQDIQGVFEHLDGCEACWDRLRTVRWIRSDFEGAWSDFLDEFQERMSLSTAPARETVPPLLDLVVRAVIDGSRKLAAAASARLAELPARAGLEATFAPAYAGVGEAGHSQEALRLTEEASNLLGAGEVQEALHRLDQAAQADPSTCGSAQLLLARDGRSVGRVVVSALRRTVSVLLDPELAGIEGGEVILTLEAAPDRPWRGRLETVEGAPYLLAEFDGVPDGQFTVAMSFKTGS